MIKKTHGLYVVLSESTHLKGSRKVHKILGRYRTKAEAVKRLQQVEFFKRMNPVRGKPPPRGG